MGAVRKPRFSGMESSILGAMRDISLEHTANFGSPEGSLEGNGTVNVDSPEGTPPPLRPQDERSRHTARQQSAPSIGNRSLSHFLRGHRSLTPGKRKEDVMGDTKVDEAAQSRSIDAGRGIDRRHGFVSRSGIKNLT